MGPAIDKDIFTFASTSRTASTLVGHKAFFASSEESHGDVMGINLEINGWLFRGTSGDVGDD